ncbi:MAG: putative metal-binding motif-containing protein [Sandaracinus sp.]
MIAAAAMTLGCPDASCPAGSMAIGERCVAVDAGADAPGAPDACTLNARYEDHDDDGYGDGEPVLRCPGPGSVLNRDDCDDGDATRRPGATEVCNGLDDDCDGATDEGLQQVLGTPFVLEETAESGWIDAARVGDAYVVIWNGEGGVYARRYDRLGAPLGAPTLVSDQASDSLLRVLARDESAAIFAFQSGDPPGLLVVTAGTTTDPMTLGAPQRVSDPMTPSTAGFAWGPDLSVAVLSSPAPFVQAFDASLSLAGSGEVGISATSIGLLPGPDGPLLLGVSGAELRLIELRRDTFEIVATSTIDGTGAAPFLAAEAPGGRVHVIRAGTDIRVISFDRSMVGEADFRPEELPLSVSALDTGVPGFVAHEAGLDLALPRRAPSTELQMLFVTPDGAITMESPTLTADDLGVVRSARLSSRDGAAFFVSIRGGDSRLEMVRVGCE